MRKLEAKEREVVEKDKAFKNYISYACTIGAIGISACYFSAYIVSLAVKQNTNPSKLFTILESIVYILATLGLLIFILAPCTYYLIFRFRNVDTYLSLKDKGIGLEKWFRNWNL